MPNGHNDNAWDYQEEIARITARLEWARDASRAEVTRLAHQVDQLTRERDGWRLERDQLYDANQQLGVAYRRVFALLREVEWVDNVCPICKRMNPTAGFEAAFAGHTSDCRLKAALEGRGE